MKHLGKTVFGLVVGILVGLLLQGCCFHRNVEASPLLSERSEDGQAWMELDTVNYALIGCYNATGGLLVDTLAHDKTGLELYPKRVHSIKASDGSMIYLFIYSRGHLLYYDEAQTYVFDEYGFRPLTLFLYEYQWDCRVSCMWYDQLVAASDGFPFDDPDDDRFGINYDVPSPRLYIPKMEHHEEGSGFENCLRYTGRFDVLQFQDDEFTLAGEDGAWWLHPDMRNYKRTISNRKTTEGYEQIDLMPDSTYRRAIWKGAKTLDDLHKKPSELKMIPCKRN